MATLDWIFMALLVLSMLVGLWRGLMYEVLSVLGWVGAFFLAQWLAPRVAEMLPLKSASDPIRYALAFVLTFIGSVFTAGLVAALIKKLVTAIGLRPVDRVLGGLFGLVRGAVLLLAVTVAVDMTPIKSALWWQESRGAHMLSAVLVGLKPVLPEQFVKYLF